MQDETKNNKELIDELISLRRQVAELEKSEQEYKKIEKELLKIKERFHLSSRATKDAIYEWDIAKNQLWCNEGMQKAMGVGEIMEGAWDWWMQLIHPDDRDRIVFGVEKLLQSDREVGGSEYRLRRPDGQYMYINHRIYVLRDAKGEALRVIGAATNVTKHRQAIDALKESEEKHRLYFENVSEVAYAIDTGLRILNMSPSIEKLLGYKPEEIIGRPIQELNILAPEYLELALSDIMKVFSGETISASVYEFISKDGTRRFGEVSGSPIFREGKVAGLISVARDITDRKKMEDELRLSEEKYRNLVENINEVVFETNEHGIVTYISSSIDSLRGYKPSDILGKSFVDFIYSEDLPRILDMYQKIQVGSVPISEYRLILKSGELIWVQSSSRAIFEEDRFKGLRGILTAVDERKRMEGALRQSEARYRQLVESTTDIIWSLDMALKFTYISPAVTRMLGYTSEEVLQGNLYNYFNYLSPDFRLNISKYFINILSPEGSKISSFLYRPMEVELVHKNGSKVWTETRISILREEDGRPLGIFGITRDISERKKADEERKVLEERLQRAEKMEALGTMAGGVAHDLNNVLGIVVGYAELLRDKIDAASPIRHHVMYIMEGGEMAAAIVQDLLTLARRGVQTRKVINLNTTIADFKKSPEFLKISSFHPHVQIMIRLEEDLLNITGSGVHLDKTVMNLVINAVEAMPHGGLLTITTSNQYLDRPVQGYDEVREGDYVVLSVSDTGEGIPAADVKHIFEPFYTRKVMGKSGTGLGLAVVWSTIKDHDGYINVQSEEGKGTTFTLYFPVTREGISEDRMRVAVSQYMGNGEAILVVDDVEGQRELASQMLNKLNYHVATVGSGEEAVAYVKEHRVDLIVLDMIMDPGMDGFDTYQKILEVHPKQRAIIVSGFSETDRVKKAQELGAGDYVQKPYILEKIGLAVKKELNK